MAVNPMQRRARNSFLIGFLVALIIMAMVVLGLVVRMRKVNEELVALQQKQVDYFVAKKDIASGTQITSQTYSDYFSKATVRTTVKKDAVLSSDDFEEVDEEGNVVEKTLEMIVPVPEGTIVTKDLLFDVEDPVTDSQRIVEYNNILLPSQLKNGDYIDVRLTLPTGQDYVVLSKKKVLGTTATSVWLKLDEFEIALINSAIVESYAITGTKLYATEYSRPGMQQPLVPTYTVSNEVRILIENNPNIVNEARSNYLNGYDYNARRDFFETNYVNLTQEDRNALVHTGNKDEVEAVKSSRELFVKDLEGTDDIGYNHDKE